MTHNTSPASSITYEHNHITPDKSSPLTPLRERRYWSNVEKTETCWLWKGTQLEDYGRFGNQWAHRIAWMLEYGPLPPGMTIDHLREAGICTSKLCVNPAHLEPVTRAENAARYQRTISREAPNATCRKGHPKVKGKRCPTCHKECLKRWAEAHPEKYREINRNQKRKERRERRQVAA